MEVAVDVCTLDDDFVFVLQEPPVLLKDIFEPFVPGSCIAIEGFVKEKAKRLVH